MSLLNEKEGWPLSNREYAFGWAVFGIGLSIEKAQSVVAGLDIKTVESWSLKQRRALAGFNNMIERMIGPRPYMVLAWDDPVL